MTDTDARTIAAEYHGSAWNSLTEDDQGREIARMSAALGCRTVPDARKALESAREEIAGALRQLDINVSIAKRDHPEGPTVNGRRLENILTHTQEILASHVKDHLARISAAIDAALASGEQGNAPKPDYCYDPHDWEYTHDWADRDLILEEKKPWDIVEPMRIATLAKCPDKWVIAVPIEWDDGEADEWEFQWFDSKEQAAAARANAAPPAPETRS